MAAGLGADERVRPAMGRVRRAMAKVSGQIAAIARPPW